MQTLTAPRTQIPFPSHTGTSNAGATTTQEWLSVAYPCCVFDGKERAKKKGRTKGTVSIRDRVRGEGPLQAERAGYFCQLKQMITSLKLHPLDYYFLPLDFQGH